MSINTFLRILILQFVLFLLLPRLALAQNPGDLDPSFGQGGITTTNFADENESHAQALVVQPDGKIVAGGYNHNGGSVDFSLMRYFPDGSLDSSFDGDGKVTTKFGAESFSQVSALALQPDGKIIAAGDGYSGGNVIALARYHPDGSLDLTFDGDGKVTTRLGYYEASPQALVIQPDGKLVVASVGLTYRYRDITLVRYNTNGSLDTSFGDEGKVNVPLTSKEEYKIFLALQPDGKLVVSGYNGSDFTFALARYQADGSLDPTFDGDGVVIGPRNSVILALTLQPDGKLAVTGYGFSVWGTARYNADGTLASSFDGLPLSQIDNLIYDDLATLLQPDGKLVRVGVSSENIMAIILVRHNPDGSLDTSFDGDGWLTTPLSRTSDEIAALALQPGGEIIVAGFYATGQQEDFTLARYNPDGSPDLDFDGDGWVVTQAGGSYDAIAAMALQPDGKIVVAGTSVAYSDQDVALARYHPDGSLDTGFGDDGKLRTDFNGSRDDRALDLALQPDGKIIIAGVSQEASDQPFALARYNPDGSLDPTFDGDGKLMTYIGRGGSYANAVAVQPDGKIVVGGYSYSVGQNMALVRYHPDGSLDPSFDGDGKLISSFGSEFSEPVKALVLQPDGKIVISGEQNSNLLLVRYNPDGSLDSTFSGDGVVTTTFNAGLDNRFMSLIQQADGKLVAAGSSNGEVAIARYNLDGSLDPSFDGDGKVTTKLSEGVWLPALALQPNGKLLIAGAIEDGDYSGNTIIIRYNPDGSLDPTFDDDGHLIMNASNDKDWVEAITLQPDGKIVAAGLAELPSPDFMVVRYLNPDMDLSLVKNVYPPLVRPGQTITYTLAFSNTGTEPAEGVVIIDMIPASLTVQTIANSGAAITQAGSSPAYTWMVQDMAPGEGGLITLTGRISPALAHGGRFTNTATIGANQDINPVNDTAAAGVEVTVPALAFEGTPYRVGEAAPEAVITLTLSAASLVEVTVDYNTVTGGTAQPGRDYATTGGSLSFMAGLTVATFTVPLSDDNLAEGNETVKLRLSHPSGANLALPDQQTTLTLLDDDTAGLRLPTLLTATEGLTATYSLYLTSRPTAPVTITLTTDSQIEVKPTRLVFPPQAWNQPQQVIVTALDDKPGEGNHTGTISHTLTSPDLVYDGLGRLRLVVRLKETSTPLFLPVLLRQVSR